MYNSIDPNKSYLLAQVNIFANLNQTILRLHTYVGRNLIKLD